MHPVHVVDTREARVADNSSVAMVSMATSRAALRPCGFDCLRRRLEEPTQSLRGLRAVRTWTCGHFLNKLFVRRHGEEGRAGVVFWATHQLDCRRFVHSARLLGQLVKQQQQQQQHNLATFRCLPRGASTPLPGVESCFSPAK